MKTRSGWMMLMVAVLVAQRAQAGDLNVVGNVTVASNLTAQTISLGGETRSNWPSGGGVATGATDLATALLDFAQPGPFVRYTLTNSVTWVFTNHVAGRQVWLQVAQNATGGWTNTWPTNVLWAAGVAVPPATGANAVSLFQVLDNGTNWLMQADGVGFAAPPDGYALQFDGTQNYVGASWSDTTYSGPWTIEFWMKGTNVTSDGTVFRSYGSQLMFIGLKYQTVANRVGIYSSGTSLNFSIDNIATLDGGWHHLAFSTDGTTLRAFKDGTLIGSTTHRSVRFSGDVKLGTNNYGAGLQGALDEIRVSSVARYTSNFTPATSFTTDSDTVAYWKFNGGSGSAAADETSNHNGTLQGNPLPAWTAGR